MAEHFFSDRIYSPFSSYIISEQNKPYLIAEIGLNHNKDIELAEKMILAAKKAGANAVKFQSYTTENFINKEVKSANALFEIFKKYELSFEDHLQLKECADNASIDFISTPLSVDWVQKLFELKVPYFKIASGDINNYILLKQIVRYNTPVIVSTGNTFMEDIENNRAFLQLSNKKDAVYLHCISVYPAPSNNLNLATIPYLKKRLNSLVGFSDHSLGPLAPFGAVMLGAAIIEKHFTLDKKLPGPDHSMSINPDELSDVRSKIDEAFEMRGSCRTEPLYEESASDEMGKRSIYMVDGKMEALRPRQKGYPRDSDYFNIF